MFDCLLIVFLKFYCTLSIWRIYVTRKSVLLCIPPTTPCLQDQFHRDRGMCRWRVLSLDRVLTQKTFGLTKKCSPAYVYLSITYTDIGS